MSTTMQSPGSTTAVAVARRTRGRSLEPLHAAASGDDHDDSGRCRRAALLDAVRPRSLGSAARRAEGSRGRRPRRRGRRGRRPAAPTRPSARASAQPLPVAAAPSVAADRRRRATTSAGPTASVGRRRRIVPSRAAAGAVRVGGRARRPAVDWPGPCEAHGGERSGAWLGRREAGRTADAKAGPSKSLAA